MLRLFSILFGRRREPLRIEIPPHHSVQRTMRPLDTVDRPDRMPNGRFGYRASNWVS